MCGVSSVRQCGGRRGRAAAPKKWEKKKKKKVKRERRERWGVGVGLVGGYESREGKKSEKIEERYGVVRKRER